MRKYPLGFLLLFTPLLSIHVLAGTFEPENCLNILKNARTHLVERVAEDDRAIAYQLHPPAPIDRSASVAVSGQSFTLTQLLDMDTTQESKLPTKIWKRLSPEDRAIADRMITIHNAILDVGPAYLEFHKAHFIDPPELDARLKSWIDNRFENVIRRLSRGIAKRDELSSISEDLHAVLLDIESLRLKRDIPTLVARLDADTNSDKRVVAQSRVSVLTKILNPTLTMTQASPTNISSIPVPSMTSGASPAISSMGRGVLSALGDKARSEMSNPTWMLQQAPQNVIINPVDPAVYIDMSTPQIFTN